MATNTTQVYNQQLSHGGTLDLVEGDFTSVGGLPRQQIFMLNLAGATATVTGWTSPEWDGSNPAYPYQCATRAVLHPGRRLVTRRLDGLHRHHRLAPERLPDRADPAQRALRRRGGFPGHPDVGDCTTGSTTPGVTRSTRRRRTPPRPTSPGTRGSPSTRRLRRAGRRRLQRAGPGGA